MARVKKLKINNSEYDIKDALSRKALDVSRCNETLSTDEAALLENIQIDIRDAVGDSPTDPTTSGNNTIDDIVEALAKVNIKARGAVASITATKDSTTKIITLTPTNVAGTTGSAISTEIASTDYVTAAVAAASAGAVHFQGNLTTPQNLPTGTSYRKDSEAATVGVTDVWFCETTNYKAGWYWVVSTGEGGYYCGSRDQGGGQATAMPQGGYLCEVGDMIFCIKDYNSTSGYQTSDFTVVQSNINPNLYAKLAGGTSSEPQPFTGYNSFSNPVTVATPTANSHAATKKYVDDAVAGDKVHDYEYISAEVSGNTYETFTLGTNLYSSIASAYTNKKIPVVALSLGHITGTCPIVMSKYGATVTEYYGSAYITKDSTKIFVGVRADSSSTKVTVTLTPTSITTTSLDASYAEYLSNDEAIKFTTVAPLASATLA